MSWGRLEAYEVYEDTQKADALDEYLASTGQSWPSALTVGLTPLLKFPVGTVDATGL